MRAKAGAAITAGVLAIAAGAAAQPSAVTRHHSQAQVQACETQEDGSTLRVNLLVFVDPEFGDYVVYTVFHIVNSTLTIVDGSVDWLPLEAGALQIMKHGKQATFEQGNVSATWQATGDYYTVGDGTDKSVSLNQIETTKSEYTQRAAHALVTAFGRVFNSAGPECAGSLNTATILDFVATTTTRIK